MYVKKQQLKISDSLIFGILSAVIFILVLNRSDVAIEYMNKGLQLCKESVIPSLFPFMVISNLIVDSGIGMLLSRMFRKPMNFLFGVGEAGACACIMGALCGFPIGAKTAVTMYDNGFISKKELSKILCICNNPGSAFIISVIGFSLFSCREIGTILYVCILLSSATVGILANLFFKEKENGRTVATCFKTQKVTIETFTSAVEGSARAMLTVCAYVVFFSAFVGCIGSVLSAFDVSDFAKACIFSFFELSGGVSAASRLENGMLSVLLCAMAGGWSGLSVHFQIMTVCSGRSISFKPYFVAKAAQGVISAVYTLAAIKFVFPNVIQKLDHRPEQVFYNFDFSDRFALFCCLAAITPILINFFLKCFNEQKNKKIRQKI